MECRRGLAMRKLSVCLSVRLSVCCQTRELWQNGKNLSIFLYQFSEKNDGWGATPCTWNFGSTSPSCRERNRRF